MGVFKLIPVLASLGKTRGGALKTPTHFGSARHHLGKTRIEKRVMMTTAATTMKTTKTTDRLPSV